MSRNRLASETSPYLLQHKDNPVHWWAWGEDALAEAKRTSKPILLSVGYAACHWCHVMAHESFEDADTAEVMNELFVNVKVDREERPDIDTIYMQALQNLGEQGGWPLTMFLTPEAEPFWGGTYFPKETKHGRPAFIVLLREVERVFREQPENVRKNADYLKSQLEPKVSAADPTQIAEPLIANAASRLLPLMDPVNGGLGQAPKFPQCSSLELLWRAGLRYQIGPALQAVLKTLTHICQGGIYDHLGGGFARYAVDQRWLVPHFEKMLYDNAQLMDLMTQAWREFQGPLLAQRVDETADWLLSEMIAEGGGFAASLDADSEGVEGKFYVWSAQEIDEVLGANDAVFFAGIYDLTPGGNWEGQTILNRLGSLKQLDQKTERRLEKLRAKLLKARAKRIRPGWDDKVLADWNGLMIAALARAADTFSRAEWLGAAERAYIFVVEKMTMKGRLLHAYRDGKASAPATASDYANMIGAALALHGITGEARFLNDAQGWTEVLDKHYWAGELGGYYFTADDTGDVIVRTRQGHDDATPNANGTMISNLVQLWLLTGDEAYRDRAEATLGAFAGAIWQNPIAFSSLIVGALDLLAPQHVVLIAPKATKDADAFKSALNGISLPGAVVQVVKDPSQIAGTSPASAMKAKASKPTAYVCIGPQCSAPITEAKKFQPQVRELRQTTVQLAPTEQTQRA